MGEKRTLKFYHLNSRFGKEKRQTQKQLMGCFSFPLIDISEFTDHRSAIQYFCVLGKVMYVSV